MINCIAIDDEPLALAQISAYIEKTPYLTLVEKFTSALKALNYLEENSVDLMFVDINMPDISGLDFVKAIQSSAKIILTTAYREYAVEGFQVDAADYLVKPISYAKFLTSVEKTKERYFTNSTETPVINNSDTFLFIKSEYKIVRVDFEKIVYIEGMGDYVRIHVTDQKPIMSLMSMKKIAEHIPKSTFMRVHRSFIVNLTKITTIEKNRIMYDDVEIPVSNQYKEDFQKFIEGNFLV